MLSYFNKFTSSYTTTSNLNLGQPSLLLSSVTVAILALFYLYAVISGLRCMWTNYVPLYIMDWMLLLPFHGQIHCYYQYSFSQVLISATSHSINILVCWFPDNLSKEFLQDVQNFPCHHFHITCMAVAMEFGNQISRIKLRSSRDLLRRTREGAAWMGQPCPLSLGPP